MNKTVIIFSIFITVFLFSCTSSESREAYTFKGKGTTKLCVTDKESEFDITSVGNMWNVTIVNKDLGINQKLRGWSRTGGSAGPDGSSDIFGNLYNSNDFSNYISDPDNEAWQNFKVVDGIPVIYRYDVRRTNNMFGWGDKITGHLTGDIKNCKDQSIKIKLIKQ